MMTREEAWALLTEFNQDPFHLRHALTVEAVMRRFAVELGYGEEVDFWGLAGLLHDLDFEKYPDQHCVKCQEIMRERHVDERLIRAVACHGYGICVDIRPEHPMEKILFACDELTGLIGACALVRPSQSIQQGADLLGWTLDDLMTRTLEAMKPDEARINETCAALAH